jgi:hypothetical protein
MSDAGIRLMVPTLMCEALMAIDTTGPAGQNVPAGSIVPMPYGNALMLIAMGGVRTIKDADLKHIEAHEHLKTYGADGWFPQHQQTIRHVADYLAQTAGDQKVN